MLSPDDTRELARRLYAARKGRTQLAHFSRAHPQMTVADGYAIQREWVRLEQADGRVVKGRKIGLTSLAVQKQQVTAELIRLREIENQRKAIEKWDGRLPQVTGGATPFINVQPGAK